MRGLGKIATFISIVATSFLIWLIYFSPQPDVSPVWAVQLPLLNACLNFLSAFCLVQGFLSIKKQLKEKHKRWMVAAFSFSTLFLFSYILYHHFHGDSPFQGVGAIRPIYFFILISHIVLSMIVLPFVLTTFVLGITAQFPQHRRLARWTFPVWLYVSVTGVLIFVLLKIYS